MDLQVLLSTMNQTDESIIDDMNIRSDAIIINQTNKVEHKIISKNGLIKWYSFDEVGIGRSRNNALLRANADICLFSDDDVIYNDSYEQIVISAFEDNKKADIIFFNLNPIDGISRGVIPIVKNKKLSFYNAFKYGAPQMAVRLSSIRQKNIHFSLLFGGGAMYSAGEDSLFISDAIKRGLKLYACKDYIGSISHEESTWFEGYTDKFFQDKGVFFYHLSPFFSILLAFQFAFRHRKTFANDRSFKEVYQLIIEGIKSQRFNSVKK